MEVAEIKDKMPPFVTAEPGQSTPKKSKKADLEETETKSLEKMPEANEEAIRKLIENINQMLSTMNFSLQFVLNREAEQVIIKVLDSQGNLIRQIPPEAVTSLSSNLEEGLGLLFNGKL
jgi:flagellar protein FlaG